MGAVYRRRVKVCTSCDRRLDTTADQRACETASHLIEVREQGPWWIRYSVGGQLQCVSSESYKRADAVRLLKEREGNVAKGMPITADVGKIQFEEATDDLLTDYRINKRRSLRTVTLRIRKHLTPFFGERRLAGITPPLIRQYIARRQASGASNATINRDLITLKRMFNLAMQSGKLMTRPSTSRF
jgi:hypothetical protein